MHKDSMSNALKFANFLLVFNCACTCAHWPCHGWPYLALHCTAWAGQYFNDTCKPIKTNSKSNALALSSVCQPSCVPACVHAGPVMAGPKLLCIACASLWINDNCKVTHKASTSSALLLSALKYVCTCACWHYQRCLLHFEAAGYTNWPWHFPMVLLQTAQDSD